MAISSKIYDAFMHHFESRGLWQLRRRVMGKVYGDVLELGPGTGANLKYCRKGSIRSMTYLDLKFKHDLIVKAKLICPDIRLVVGDAQALPFPDQTFDCVVFTLVFCTVGDPMKGLAEVRRVLKDDGTIHFIEHVKPNGGVLRPLFNGVNPLWRSMAGGCNLNRDTLRNLEDAGFEIQSEGSAFNEIFVAGVGKKQS